MYKCEGMKMTIPVSSVQIPQQPVGAYTIGGNFGQNLRPGHYVVNPPVITPYSFYDDLKKGDNYYNELLQVFSSKEHHHAEAAHKKSVFKKILGWGIVIGGAILAYKNRSVIENYFKNLRK